MSEKQSKISRALAAIQNAFIFPSGSNQGGRMDLDLSRTLFNKTAGGSKDPVKNLSNTFMPVPPRRKREDIPGWRDAIIESENSILPYRVKMQEIFRDTVLDVHIMSCIVKRKNLTLLRKYALVDKDGVPNNEWTEYLKKTWFRNFMSYVLDARFFGYSLISLGDIYENNFKEVTIVRRDNISPERKQVNVFPYDPTGTSWEIEPFSAYHIWVPTPTDHGTASVGFGLLYNISLDAISLRNTNQFNADFMEMFAAPYRYIKTDISDPTERANMENSLKYMGSMNYGVFNKDTEVGFIESKGGNGYKAYTDYVNRKQADISKLLLGHSDAITSTPGKLGGGQGGGKSGADHSPSQQALNEIQESDGNFLEPIVNDELLTRLRYHGINIPEDLTFQFLNSDEEEQLEEKQNNVNLILSQIIKNITGSNILIDPDWFEQTTGISLTQATEGIQDVEQESTNEENKEINNTN